MTMGMVVATLFVSLTSRFHVPGTQIAESRPRFGRSVFLRISCGIALIRASLLRLHVLIGEGYPLSDGSYSSCVSGGVKLSDLKALSQRKAMIEVASASLSIFYRHGFALRWFDVPVLQFLWGPTEPSV